MPEAEARQVTGSAKPDLHAGGGDPAGFPFWPALVAAVADVAKPGLSIEAAALRDATTALNAAYRAVLQFQEWAAQNTQRAVELKASRDRMRTSRQIRLLDLAIVRAHARAPRMKPDRGGAPRKEGTDTFLLACCWAWQSFSGRWPSPGQNGARFASPGMRFIAGCAELARLALTVEDRDTALLRAADAQLAPLTLSQDVRGENSRHATLRTRLARVPRPRAN